MAHGGACLLSIISVFVMSERQVMIPRLVVGGCLS